MVETVYWFSSVEIPIECRFYSRSLDFFRVEYMGSGPFTGPIPFSQQRKHLRSIWKMMIFSPADVVYRGLVIYTESTLYGTVQLNGSVTLTYPGETFFRVTLTACTNCPHVFSFWHRSRIFQGRLMTPCNKSLKKGERSWSISLCIGGEEKKNSMMNHEICLFWFGRDGGQRIRL